MCSHGKFVSTNGVITCGLCGKVFTKDEYFAFIKGTDETKADKKGKGGKDKEAAAETESKEGS